MRRVMSYVAPWVGVTALAVTLSWLGVRDVVRATVTERAAQPPIAGPVISASPPDATAGSTARPDGRARAAASRGNVRSYALRGGQAAMSLDGGEVRLVSATPNPGYETRVTQSRDRLRVDFRGDRRTSSIVASWDGDDPLIKVYEY
ncbi:hypothetical protein [Actinomadura sp. WMMB 499]|uniref:hypothetical protein n=1 Tax=Actinomadura sp. WMMB 499 TaxID=1219491 RepID=UPI00124945CD|nr:hypothetical protein [Actinomadura sp. WMMB 499]QFG25533.1 hypothetical protein F7P10_34725 [Actinomadura sp. WMMB 499]